MAAPHRPGAAQRLDTTSGDTDLARLRVRGSRCIVQRMLLQGALVLTCYVLSYWMMRRLGRSRRQACRDSALVLAFATFWTQVQRLVHLDPLVGPLLVSISGTPIVFLLVRAEQRRRRTFSSSR